MGCGTGSGSLPEGWSEFVSTLAPAWEADGRLVYGAFFWVNGDGGDPIPENAYSMRGAGGQSTIIIPTHDLVVVRLGHYKGAGPGGQGLRNALALLIEAVRKVGNPRRKTRSWESGTGKESGVGS